MTAEQLVDAVGTIVEILQRETGATLRA